MTLKYALTDDQLGQYYRKMNVIADRLGKSLPFDQVMAALQAIHDGKEPVIPTLITEPKFAKWRSFLIGGVSKQALLQRVKSGFEVGSYPESLVNNKVFTTLDQEEEINTIILTPGDFGYERNPTTTELFDPTRLAEWSKQNQHRLPEGYDAIELLPAEAGLHIRDQYKDQPKGEVLWIAMERITGSDGNPDVFSVERNDDGEQWLDAYWTSPDIQWILSNRIVFRLRNLLHFSPVPAGEFCLITCPYQPPSILPTSASFSDISAYCFVSKSFISHIIWRNTFVHGILIQLARAFKKVTIQLIYTRNYV